MVRVFICAVVFMLAMGTGAFAHPPQAVDLELDKEEGVLTAAVTHTVSDPDGHYVFNLVVKVNGTVVEDEELEGQDDENGLLYETVIEGLSSGDTVEVTASCNKGGEKSASLVVE